MQLNLQTFLPQFAIVKEASTHDSTEAYRLCVNLKSGEIAVFGKALNGLWQAGKHKNQNLHNPLNSDNQQDHRKPDSPP